MSEETAICEQSKHIKKKLVEIYNRKTLPPVPEYLEVLKQVNYVLENENESIRPYGTEGINGNKPGGVIQLKQYTPVIIVPDLHARLDFFIKIMLLSDDQGETNIDKLSSDTLQIVCVGDGFHAEGRAVARWQKAFEEFTTKYKRHRHMDEEMRESLGIMEMVMFVKTAFPDNFHFLKGNHENIMNEGGGGNFPFRKYAYEGAMVFEFINRFYGVEFLTTYYTFEKNLPLFAVGKNFLVSHAEPASAFDRKTIINYRGNTEVVAGLTWTDNGAARQGSVQKMIQYYLDESQRDDGYYFGGHRAVTDRYFARAGGKYIQLHNPKKHLVARIPQDRPIDLENDIIELNGQAEDYIKNSVLL
ncbi:MAG: metallophosphoesterase [Spirochaetales bacterium]|nr:metallophosphoesterase [Spirochaetales bacterium]